MQKKEVKGGTEEQNIQKMHRKQIDGSCTSNYINNNINIKSV